MIGWVLFFVAFTTVSSWACAVSEYRRRNADTYEKSSGLLAWGARSERYRGRSPEEVRRASTYEFWFWLAILVIGEIVIAYSLAA